MEKLHSVYNENSIGNKATGTALTSAHTAAVDGYHVLNVSVSAAPVQIQCTVNNGSVNDTFLLNGGQQIAAGARLEPPAVIPQKAGYTYTYAMVYSSGTPLCDVYSIHEYDERK